jgi:hypothetical protein
VLNEILEPGSCQAQPKKPVIVIDDLAEACEATVVMEAARSVSPETRSGAVR